MLPLALLLLAADPSPEPLGGAMFKGAFDPQRYFAGEIVPSSDDQLLLTAAASARDDYAPDYALAIAFVCRPAAGKCTGGFLARILRVASKEEEQTSASLSLVHQVRRRGAERALSAAFAAGKIEWLEADVAHCQGAIDAMDQVRLADWRPDLFYLLQRPEDREVLLHPASLDVRVAGTYTISQWRGWRNAAGVPAAVARLLEVLEPCWSKAKSPPPWRKR